MLFSVFSVVQELALVLDFVPNQKSFLCVSVVKGFDRFRSSLTNPGDRSIKFGNRRGGMSPGPTYRKGNEGESTRRECAPEKGTRRLEGSHAPDAEKTTPEPDPKPEQG